MRSGISESFRDGDVTELPPAAGLREALRAATSVVHERLHRHDGLAAVQAGTIDRAAYRQLLIRLYGFYRPFEAAAQLAPERTRWLEHDLDALGVSAAERDTLPRCAAIPPRFSPDQVLGARYVVEGSALGGRGMARQLDPLLGIGCPNIVYPYLRANIADVITRAGFPPVHLAEINFEVFYQQRLQAMSEAAAAPASGQATH